MLKWMLALCLVLGLADGFAAEEMYLRQNLSKARRGDYLITLQNKTYTALVIKNKSAQELQFEEISIPTNRIVPSQSWRNWLLQGAPGNTSWISYRVNTVSGTMTDCFSHTKNMHFEVTQADNFLTKLLNLRLTKVPLNKRKRVGPSLMGAADTRNFWNPKLVIDGQEISGVQFAAWQTYWPNDGSELSNKMIEVYVPEEDSCYPSYFPYWLQISGVVGKAKVRIIDAGVALFKN